MDGAEDRMLSLKYKAEDLDNKSKQEKDRERQRIFVSFETLCKDQIFKLQAYMREKNPDQ